MEIDTPGVGLRKKEVQQLKRPNSCMKLVSKFLEKTKTGVNHLYFSSFLLFVFGRAFLERSGLEKKARTADRA